MGSAAAPAAVRHASRRTVNDEASLTAREARALPGKMKNNERQTQKHLEKIGVGDPLAPRLANFIGRDFSHLLHHDAGHQMAKKVSGISGVASRTAHPWRRHRNAVLLPVAFHSLAVLLAQLQTFSFRPRLFRHAGCAVLCRGGLARLEHAWEKFKTRMASQRRTI